MAWEGQNLYESIEEVRSYPVDTTLYFMKLQKPNWPAGVSEMLQLSQGVRLKGGRYYLASRTVERSEFPGKQRINIPVMSNYFEASTDNLSVKNTFVVSIPGLNQGNGALAGSTTQRILHSYIESIQNLRKLLDKVSEDHE